MVSCVTVIETARATMTAYLDALLARGTYEQFFTPDAGLYLMGTDQEAHGRDEVLRLIRYLHEQAFDAHPQLKCLLVDGEKCALEADFVGTHIAEFAGKPATGKEVRVPYSVVYDLEGQQISALRIYLSLDAHCSPTGGLTGAGPGKRSRYISPSVLCGGGERLAESFLAGTCWRTPVT
jgi:predicted ester cyclase